MKHFLKENIAIFLYFTETVLKISKKLLNTRFQDSLTLYQAYTKLIPTLSQP